MTTGGERRMQKALHKASGRQKGLLIVNHNAAVLLGAPRLLTEGEERDIVASVTLGLEGQGFVEVLSGGAALDLLVQTLQHELRGVAAKLLHISDIFASALQYRYFENLINDLCMGTTKRSRELREQCLEYAKWYPFLGTFTLVDDDEYGFVRFDLFEEYAANALKVIENAVLDITSIKTSIQVAYDFMEEYKLRITPYEKSLANCESEARRCMHMTRQLLLPEPEGVPALEPDETRVDTANRLMMLKEALPEYDTLAINEQHYEETFEMLEQRQWRWNHQLT